jgi:toxin YoeB
MNILFHQAAFAEYRQWAAENPKIFDKINNLITEITRDPFHGTGKPEPLKHELSGVWSRRITKEHRLLYKVSVDQITIASCRYHYK